MNSKFSENYSNSLEDILNFARCLRPDGTVYGSRGKCRKGTEIGEREVVPKASSGKQGKPPSTGKPRISQKVAQLSVSSLEKMLKDPRLSRGQAKTIKNIIESKKSGTGSAAQRMAAAAERLEKSSPEPKPKKVAAQDKSPTQTKAKPKPKETPEEKEEKRWLAQKAEADAIQAKHEQIKAELKAKGIKFFATGSGAYTLRETLRKRGIPTESELSRMRVKLSQTEPEGLKRKRIAVGRERIAAEIAGTSREKRKEMLQEDLRRLKNNPRYRTLKEVDDMVRITQSWIDTDLSRATLKNRVALTALRVLRAQMVRDALREKAKGGVSLEEALRESPRYDKTPGSREPMKAKYEESLPHPARLEMIYTAQGFNAKPELVRSRTDLESRQDIVRDSGGRALILYRGVSEERFSRQFQGSGPDGGIHYPGKGIYGNGTYAASAGGDPSDRGANPKDNPSEQAQSTAIAFSGGKEGSQSRVTAFALRSDANIVQFEGGPLDDRTAQYYRWSKTLLRDASERFGEEFIDVGEAAAAMGIHAYRYPLNSSQDYWIILNRGAIVAAQDPELP